MKPRPFLAASLCLCLCTLTACKKKPVVNDSATPNPEIKAEAAKLQTVKDPVLEAIYRFRVEVRQDYNNRRFDALETRATALRASKELCDNGSWKLVQFYQALSCGEEEPESMWKLHDQICRDWIAAEGNSMTARVAYAELLIDYAWHARGSGYADTVTREGERLFEERLAAAHKVLDQARALPDKDPHWWKTMLRVALGEGFSKEQFDALLAEALAFEPKFWGYESARAYSLLPRWYGEPGEWEDFADQAAARPDGFGTEIYARIVTDMSKLQKENIFQNPKVSWPRTRDGMAELRQKYPNSLQILSDSALLAVLAEDRALAQEMFAALGDRYLPSVWREPDYYAHCRLWARTGLW